MKLWTQRRRRQIAWLCAAVALWMPWYAQLHGLQHAQQAAQEAGLPAVSLAPSTHEGAARHAAQVCEQCLLLSALDGALPSRAFDLAPAAAAPVAPLPVAHRRDASPFFAYLTRAPPRRA